MKKILSVIMAVAILLTSAVSVFASEGTRFVRREAYRILTEDGRLFDINGNELVLFDTDVKDFCGDFYIKNNILLDEYKGQYGWEYDMRDFIPHKVITNDVVQATDGSFYGYLNISIDRTSEDLTNGELVKDVIVGKYLLTEQNNVYSFDFDLDGELLYSNISDYVVTDYHHQTILFRSFDGKLYCNKELILENCSRVYGGNSAGLFYAKTNDGKWYHWGNNHLFQLEAEKFVDGNNITPEEFENPTIATQYIMKTKIGDCVWNLDGSVYFNGTKIADNVIHSITFPYEWVTSDGNTVIIREYTGAVGYYNSEYKDINDLQKLHNGGLINKDGNLAFYSYQDNEFKIIYANKKYLNCSDWAISEIESAENIGYIDSVKLFDMQSNINREDFCNMIVDFCEKYLGKELSSTSNPFKDTKNEKVIKAYANGIITGISSDKFAPQDKITREQMCAIMTRTAKFLNPNVSFGQPIAFSDMGQVSSWAVEGVNAMSGLGIVKGDGYSITPQSNTSVEQAIAMTYRLYNKIK